MEYFIYNIALLLRKSGIHISSQEINDCIQLMNIKTSHEIDEYAFYNIVNATMIKTSWGYDYVLWLMELYFLPNMELTMNRVKVLNWGYGKSLGISTGKTAPLDMLLNTVLSDDFKQIYSFVKGLNLTLDPSMENRDEALDFFQKESLWTEITSIIEQSYLKEEISQNDYICSKETLDEWNKLLKGEIEIQLYKNMSLDYLMDNMSKLNPKKTSFLGNEDELMTAISQEIQKLAGKLAVRKGRRYKVSTKGVISLPITIRKCFRTGAIPFQLIKVQKKPSKPDFWILCDMSNSVSKFIYFMLMLIYTTQNYYNRIRSFAFVDTLMESTEYFNTQEWESALKELKNLKGYDITGYSHYGNVFRQFSNEYLPLLNKKNTVIILGDAKNNYNSIDGKEVLAQIKDTAGALYWLNPLTKDMWDKKDCIMNVYEPYCTGAFQCSNVEDLERFLNSI